MPLRSVKMNRFIFGFQRLVWCPKCTPLSSSCFMVTTAMAGVHLSVRRDHEAAPRLSRCAGRRHRPGVAPEPGPVSTCRRRAAGRGSRDRPGTVPQADPGAGNLTGTRTREVTSFVEVRYRAYAEGSTRSSPHPASTRSCPHRRRPVHSIVAGVPPARPRRQGRGVGGSPTTGLLRRTGRTALRRLAAVLMSAAGMLVVMCTGTPPAAAAPIGITSADPGPRGAPGTVRYSWPLSLAPAVAAPFREPTHRFGPGHRGVDLAAAPGSAVIAAAAGTR